MPLNFPNSPVDGDTYFDPNGVSWIFNGIGWSKQESVGTDQGFARKSIAQTFTAGQAGEVTTVAYAASITLNLEDSNNFKIGTLTGNLTLANPTGVHPGQSGFITLVQDGTGSRILTLGTEWEAAGGSSAIILSTAAGTKDLLAYYVDYNSKIVAAVNKGVIH